MSQTLWMEKYLIELYKLNLSSNIISDYYNQNNCDNCKIWRQFQRSRLCALLREVLPPLNWASLAP
jgi:hypothetical protein